MKQYIKSDIDSNVNIDISKVKDADSLFDFIGDIFNISNLTLTYLEALMELNDSIDGYDISDLQNTADKIYDGIADFDTDILYSMQFINDYEDKK